MLLRLPFPSLFEKGKQKVFPSSFNLCLARPNIENVGYFWKGKVLQMCRVVTCNLITFQGELFLTFNFHSSRLPLTKKLFTIIKRKESGCRRSISPSTFILPFVSLLLVYIEKVQKLKGQKNYGIYSFIKCYASVSALLLLMPFYLFYGLLV